MVDQYDERVLIGDIFLPLPRLVTYYGESLDEVHLPFNYQLLQLPWHAPAIRQALDAYEAALPPGAWPNWVLGNHDTHRIATRAGKAQARVAQMLLLTVRGTPVCYYGDEIGMQDAPISPEMIHDPQAILSPGYGRDPERSPMQWDVGPNAGFSGVAPWLPVADYTGGNSVAAQRDDPNSILTLFRQLLSIRRSQLPLMIGDQRTLDSGCEEVLAYLRSAQGHQVLVVLNLASSPQRLDMTAVGPKGMILCATHLVRSGGVNLAYLALRPNEGLVIRIL